RTGLPEDPRPGDGARLVDARSPLAAGSVAAAPAGCAAFRGPLPRIVREARRRSPGHRARRTPRAAAPARSGKPALLRRVGASPPARSQARPRSIGDVTALEEQEVLEPSRPVRRVVVGRPMRTGQMEETLLLNWIAPPVF